MPDTITDPGVTTLVDGVPRLAGAQCPACGTHTFPAQGNCPRCGSGMESTALPSEGTVWSFTVQRMAPKPPYAGPRDPDDYVPFAVAYVDLGVIKVESVLSGADPDDWAIGDEVALRLGPPDPDGEIRHFTFAPAGEASS